MRAADAGTQSAITVTNLAKAHGHRDGYGRYVGPPPLSDREEVIMEVLEVFVGVVVAGLVEVVDMVDRVGL